jgi:hypothetical protein
LFSWKRGWAAAAPAHATTAPSSFSAACVPLTFASSQPLGSAAGQPARLPGAPTTPQARSSPWLLCETGAVPPSPCCRRLQRTRTWQTCCPRCATTAQRAPEASMPRRCPRSRRFFRTTGGLALQKGRQQQRGRQPAREARARWRRCAQRCERRCSKRTRCGAAPYIHHHHHHHHAPNTHTRTCIIAANPPPAGPLPALHPHQPRAVWAAGGGAGPGAAVQGAGAAGGSPAALAWFGETQLLAGRGGRRLCVCMCVRVCDWSLICVPAATSEPRPPPKPQHQSAPRLVARAQGVAPPPGAPSAEDGLRHLMLVISDDTL